MAQHEQAVEIAGPRHESLLGVLHDIRTELWHMNRSDDLDRVVLAVATGLDRLQVPYAYYSVSLVDDTQNPRKFKIFGPGGRWDEFEISVDGVNLENLIQFWRGQTVVYRPDLASDDPFGEAASLGMESSFRLRSVIDVPFAHGTFGLSVHHPDAYSAEDIRILEEMAQVLSEGVSRRRDFEILEQRNRDLEDQIQERMRAQQALMQSSRLIALGQMAAGVVHELNQPLTGISLTADMLRIEAEDQTQVSPQQLKDAAELIGNQVERITRIVEHLRTFSRNRRHTASESVRLANVVDNALIVIGTQLKNASVEVELEVDEQLPEVEGDPFRLEQVVLNLLDNAKDALDVMWHEMDADERRQWQKRLWIRTSLDVDDTDWVILEVEDNGPGIGEEHRQQLFEPFFTTKDHDNGTGLGLSISDSIVRDHGGEIDSHRSGNGGALFRVRLPIAAVTDPASVAAPPGGCPSR